MNYIGYFDGFTQVRCVCVRCGVNRKWKWVFSYVRQHLAPTHTGELWSMTSCSSNNKFCFWRKCIKNDSQIFILTPLLQGFNI